MKQFIFLLYLGIVVSGCKKELVKEHANNTNERSIVGKWEWYIATTYSFEFTPQSTGRTWGFIFNADSTCTRAGDIRPPSTGTYSLESNPNNPSSPWFKIKISLAADTKIYGQRLQSSDTLLLDAGSSYDAPIYYFVRVH